MCLTVVWTEVCTAFGFEYLISCTNIATNCSACFLWTWDLMLEALYHTMYINVDLPGMFDSKWEMDRRSLMKNTIIILMSCSMASGVWLSWKHGLKLRSSDLMCIRTKQTNHHLQCALIPLPRHFKFRPSSWLLKARSLVTLPWKKRLTVLLAEFLLPNCGFQRQLSSSRTMKYVITHKKKSLHCKQHSLP